jgi:hypothetical protein
LPPIEPAGRMSNLFPRLVRTPLTSRAACSMSCRLLMLPQRGPALPRITVFRVGYQRQLRRATPDGAFQRRQRPQNHLRLLGRGLELTFFSIYCCFDCAGDIPCLTNEPHHAKVGVQAANCNCGAGAAAPTWGETFFELQRQTTIAFEKKTTTVLQLKQSSTKGRFAVYTSQTRRRRNAPRKTPSFSYRYTRFRSAAARHLR